jgi:hypothetical protein
MNIELQHRIARTLQAGTRGLFVRTNDEARAVELVEGVGAALGWQVHTWSPASGVNHDGHPVPLLELISQRRREDVDALWLLLDPLGSMASAAEIRAVREAVQRSSGPALVLVDPSDRLGSSPLLDRIPELWFAELPPPDIAELRSQVEWVAGLLDDPKSRDLASASEEVARAALGLGRSAADRIIAEAIVEHGANASAIARHIARAKPMQVDPSGLLERAAPTPKSELGGLSGFKTWLQRRGSGFDPRAREAGIRFPRGVLLLGVQGCGKSLAARACADALDLPLVRLEPGRLFGGTVGSSEANLRRMTAAAEAMAPVVLWIDEVDKGLAGVDGSRSDAGTAARVIGGLLTWLQERQRPVFVAATANRVDRVPPELLRRGRLDEIFFVDLPDAAARIDVLRVHLIAVPQRELGRVPPMRDPWEAFAEVAAGADGFSGAELEAALVEARLEAFAEGRELAAADLRRAIEATIPLSVSRAEEIEALRKWAQHRARVA